MSENQDNDQDNLEEGGDQNTDNENGDGTEDDSPEEVKDEGHKEALIEFWNTRESELEEVLKLTTEYIEEKIAEVQELGDLILEWLNLGDLVMQNISKALQVYDLPDSKLEVNTDVYEKLKEHLDFIEPFSPELIDIVDVVETVKPNYAPDVFPPPPITTTQFFGEDGDNLSLVGSTEIETPAEFTSLADAIKKEIIEKMNVKEESEEIYSRLEKIFNSLENIEEIIAKYEEEF